MPDSWQQLRSHIRGHFRIFEVTEDYYSHPKFAEERSYFSIRTSNWVTIVAVTPEDQMVMIRQFRPGVAAVRLELPGGVIDPGEEPAVTAARELREETGFAGDAPLLLGEVEPNPAIQNNRCFLFLIRNAVKVGAQQLDPDEVIQVQLRPRAEALEMAQSGEISHGLNQLALLRYLVLHPAG